MNLKIRDQFVKSWRQYFGDAELPVACFYSTEDENIPLAKKPQGHVCFIAQLLAVRRGQSLCFQPDTIGCGGGKRYLGFAGQINERFEYFLSNGEDGGFCEKYKQSPDMARALMNNLPVYPTAGNNLICKRWDRLEENDHPQIVMFFATPDVLSGLFTLATFSSNDPDAVIAPFGAGCTSLVYYPYREYLEGGERAVVGLMDPSARKCVKENILSFALPIDKFLKMAGEMDDTFLTTPTWEVIRKRINAEKAISNNGK